MACQEPAMKAPEHWDEVKGSRLGGWGSEFTARGLWLRVYGLVVGAQGSERG